MFFYNNEHDGGSNSRSRAAFCGDLTFVAQGMCSSEGENIALNMWRFAGSIGKFLRDNTDKDEVWILLDAIDSGLSIDAVDDLKEGLFKTIFSYFSDKEIYIICSANEYELASDTDCFDVQSGKYISFSDYSE